MEKINISLDGGLRSHQRRQGKGEVGDHQKPDKRQVTALWNQLDDMDRDIDSLRDTTQRRLRRFKQKWLERMNAAL